MVVVSLSKLLSGLLMGLNDKKLTLLQVMGWCHQATSHYQSQCWPSSMSPFDVAGPQWVKENLHKHDHQYQVIYPMAVFWQCFQKFSIQNIQKKIRPGDPHVSLNWAIFGSGNGLLPVWRQVIIWSNAINWTVGNNDIWIKTQKYSIAKNIFENVIGYFVLASQC